MQTNLMPHRYLTDRLMPICHIPNFICGLLTRVVLWDTMTLCIVFIQSIPDNLSHVKVQSLQCFPCKSHNLTMFPMSKSLPDNISHVKVPTWQHFPCQSPYLTTFLMSKSLPDNLSHVKVTTWQPFPCKSHNLTMFPMSLPDNDLQSSSG